MTDLIYDIGMHEGEDSKFYLLKGFRVVAVEADPVLCHAAAEHLREFTATGQLTIVNRAIAPAPGQVTFYRSARSGWSTVVSQWNEDNAARGVPSEAIAVEAITLAELVRDNGDAFYMKIDIEGMDRTALQSLVTSPSRPQYLSMETSFSRNPTFAAVKADFEALAELGYDRFKIIDQRAVPEQTPPAPASAGRYVPYRFDNGESGLFGEESSGDWLTRDEALTAFRRLIRNKWVQVLLYRRLRLYLYYTAIIHRLSGRYPNLGWYDLHAKHSTVV
ncbi:FkbM family methyltransferase [Sphingomonas sp.]|uniref:FkbM family methyltransferase n=1 Tax=Sphingomonas sp. TaxID=28214 RepID=UPI00286A44DD|nr:FkbM family methyltransferase [Sphingomonas sp.]